MTRIRTLIARELLDIRRNFMVLLPVGLVTVLSIALPFVITIVIPLATGEALGDDPDLGRISALAAPGKSLAAAGRVQFFIFQQFLMMFLLTPITGAMALAAHAIIGEKQARTLEPLLATPVTTVELLVAKVVGALVPTLVISLAGLAIYFVGIGVFGDPGVLAAMATTRTAALVLLVGPGAALVSLQTAILISSRVNDARTAQQFGVLLIIPLAALMVAQFIGRVWLTTAMLVELGAALLILWVLLTVASVAVFDRESILTRWS